MENNSYREKIDAIDEQIVALFAERMKVSAEIAAYKKEHDLQVRDKKREAEKIASVRKMAPNGLKDDTEQLYKLLFRLSRDYQIRLIESGAVRTGLLGEKLGHSYSPAIHGIFGDPSYKKFEVRPKDLEAFLAGTDFTGLNVTIPYKKTVVPYLDELSPEARAVGSVNTIVRRPDNTLCGYNTDVCGFKKTVELSGVDVAGKKALVLGSGGGSLAVQYVLRTLGADVVVISRSGPDHYGNLKKHADARIIVNATPVGMYPNDESRPLSLGIFDQLEAVFDLIYNPPRTSLLLEAEDRGAKAFNGLTMLVYQAAESHFLFTGERISEEMIKTTIQTLSEETENVVLIGMPGAGKTMIAKELSRITGKTVVDTDDEILNATGQSPEEIINIDGENEFREIETTVLRTVSKFPPVILSTGGGCVTRPENRDVLKRYGRVYWITRDLDKLETAGRPLSQKNMKLLYEEREPLYRSFADEVIANDGTVKEAAEKILALRKTRQKESI